MKPTILYHQPDSETGQCDCDCACDQQAERKEMKEMKPAIISDVLHRVITVRANTQDQALNAVNAHLIEKGEAEKWEQVDCQLQAFAWPNCRYRVEFRPVAEGQTAAVYQEREERWVPA